MTKAIFKFFKISYFCKNISTWKGCMMLSWWKLYIQSIEYQSLGVFFSFAWSSNSVRKLLLLSCHLVYFILLYAYHCWVYIFYVCDVSCIQFYDSTTPNSKVMHICFKSLCCPPFLRVNSISPRYFLISVVCKIPKQCLI